MATSNARQDDTADELGIIEIELVKLVRVLDSFGRKSSLFVQVDRAGYIALRTIEGLGPSSLNILANALHLDASTVTRQVAALEVSGLVRREADTVDRRSWTISLTPAGRRTMRGVEKARRLVISELLEDWSPEEVGELARIMPKLNTSLGARLRAQREDQMLDRE
jgi:DNA-binding MarR family transcriptional regulator